MVSENRRCFRKQHRFWALYVKTVGVSEVSDQQTRQNIRTPLGHSRDMVTRSSYLVAQARKSKQWQDL